MSAEAIRIFGIKRDPRYRIERNDFKDKIHHFLDANKLYPLEHLLINALTYTHNRRTSFLRISTPAQLASFMYDRKICPHFFGAVLRTLRDAEIYLRESNKKISFFDLGRLETLSNRVYNTLIHKDKEERARWSCFEQIKTRLHNKDLSPLENLRALIDEGIVGVEDNKQQDLLPHGALKSPPQRKNLPTEKEVQRMLDQMARQQTLMDTPGFKPTKK
jgi:hypothetical protein